MPSATKTALSSYAEATRRFTSSVLNTSQKEHLRGLPRHIATERSGKRLYLTHATPSTPLYGRYAIDDEKWSKELEATSADILFVGPDGVKSVGEFLDTEGGDNWDWSGFGLHLGFIEISRKIGR